MPLYHYACRGCDNNFEKHCKMDERKIATEEPCAKCGGEIYLVIGTPGFIDDSKSTMRRAGSEWQDILKKVKKGSGRDNSIKV